MLLQFCFYFLKTVKKLYFNCTFVFKTKLLNILNSVCFIPYITWTPACDCILWSSRVTSLAAGIRAGVSRLRLGGQRVLRLWGMRLRMNQVGHLTRSCSVVGGLVVAHHHLVHRGSVHGLTVLSKGWLHVLTSLLGLAVVVMGSWMSPSWLLVTSSYQLVLIRLVMVVETVGVRRGSGGGGGHWPVHSDLTNTRHEHLDIKINVRIDIEEEKDTSILATY